MLELTNKNLLCRSFVRAGRLPNKVLSKSLQNLQFTS